MCSIHLDRNLNKGEYTCQCFLRKVATDDVIARKKVRKLVIIEHDVQEPFELSEFWVKLFAWKKDRIRSFQLDHPKEKKGENHRKLGFEKRPLTLYHYSAKLRNRSIFLLALHVSSSCPLRDSVIYKRTSFRSCTPIQRYKNVLKQVEPRVIGRKDRQEQAA